LIRHTTKFQQQITRLIETPTLWIPCSMHHHVNTPTTCDPRSLLRRATVARLRAPFAPVPEQVLERLDRAATARRRPMLHRQDGGRRVGGKYIKVYTTSSQRGGHFSIHARLGRHTACPARKRRGATATCARRRLEQAGEATGRYSQRQALIGALSPGFPPKLSSRKAGRPPPRSARARESMPASPILLSCR